MSEADKTLESGKTEATAMGRHKLPEDKKKVSVKITVDKEVLDKAKESLNASQWFNEAGREKIARKKKAE